MLRSRAIRNRLLGAALLCLFLVPASEPAHAVSKEMVELQTQVQQLLDQVQRLQSTMDSRMGVLQNLEEKTADAANQVAATVNAMQQKLNSQSDAVSGKVDTVSGQVQSLNDSVDELKARIAKLDKSLQDLQAQLQNMQAPPAGVPQQGAQPGGAPSAGPAPGPGPASNASGAAGANAPMSQQAPPLQETLQAAERDFDAGRYDVAAGEFQDVVHYYPLDDSAGTAQFYLGEIAYQKQDYAHAIDAYNAVLEGFSGNAKAPAAQLHKGYALLAQDKKDAGVRELRLLIQRHPQTPEAARARSKLNGMGVKINPTAAAKQ
jgi:TolA-binding protein